MKTVRLALVLFSSISFLPPALGADPPAESVPVTPDHSFAAPAYLQRGIPPTDRNWTPKDYEQAEAALKKLGAEDSTTLPRYQSPASGAVFARIVSRENLRALRVGGQDLGQRMDATGNLIEKVSRVLLVYATASSGGTVLDAELIELIRFTLEISSDLNRLAEAYSRLLPADDPNREARMKGREEVRQGLSKIVNGSLVTLGERGGYRVLERLRLAETLEKTLPGLLPYLPRGAAAELPGRVHQMAGEEPDPQLKERLGRIETILRKGTS
jgi:hypothetical protein